MHFFGRAQFIQQGSRLVISAAGDRRRQLRRISMLDVVMLVLGVGGFALMLGYAAVCTRL